MMKTTLPLCLLVAMFHLTVHSLTQTDHHNSKPKATDPQKQHLHEGDSLKSCQRIIPSNTDFAFQFYRQATTQEPGKNIFFSPVSISTAFALLALGSRATSQAQVLEGLAFNVTNTQEEEIHNGFHHLLLLLNRPDSQVQLSMGNTLFIDKHLKPLKTFLKDMKKLYKGKVVSVNFQNSTEAKKEVNDHIKNQTHGNINEILKDLDPNTLVVIVSYIYFKGYWENPFNNLNTRDSDFFLDAKNSVKVKMMHQSKNFNIHRDEELSCWVVEIPYKGNVTSLFVLPDEGTMKQVEDALLKETVSKWLQAFEKRKIYLDLPKFSISSSYDVKSLFQKMGVTELFTNQADLSGVAEETLLKVSKAIHKATVDVSENGTEAAAVTMIELVPLIAPFPPPPHIRFNRPFLMMIIDKSTDGVLFMGKIVNPAAKED
uniref:Serpin domain-containing protein n=1 Tax=Falco tinnunculus TaxID=100819 RepID=A0A8C4UWG9_FALTI